MGIMVHSSSLLSGTYEGKRASALSGVPLSTVYDWARKDFIVPSVSQTREKLWSYADLMALRIAYWLRHPKDAGDDALPASPMSEVRRAIATLDEQSLDLWMYEGGHHRMPLLVDPDGTIWIKTEAEYLTAAGQRGIGGVLDLLGPFGRHEEVQGPDLIRPRPHLRIVPGKVSGEPHLQHSRINTLTIAALADRGLSTAQIALMYPDQEDVAIEEAVDLERDLAAAAA